MNQDDLTAYVFTELGFCGCGDPDTTLGFLRDVLALIKSRSESTGSTESYSLLTEELDAKLGLKSNEPMYWWFWYFLDGKDLIEHGSSVRGSWLTDKGIELLAALKENDIEAILA